MPLLLIQQIKLSWFKNLPKYALLLILPECHESSINKFKVYYTVIGFDQ